MLAVFIAGNEPFNQGQVPYRESCSQAKQKKVVVNTIFCGNKAEGERTGWSDGATLADGRYLCIDSDRSVADAPTPYDKKLVELNGRLNQTYLGYGARRSDGLALQSSADKAPAPVSGGAAAPQVAESYAANRAQAKASSNYRNSDWDLVDAEKDKPGKLDDLKEEELPEVLREKSPADRRAYVEQKSKERSEIQTEIKELGRQRDDYLAKEKAKANPQNSLEDAILAAIRDQAKAKGFVFR